ncbi:hypothetical protein SFC08_01810 [Lysinibacillus halotolerans]
MAAWQPTDDELNELKLLNNENGVNHDAFYRALAPILFETAQEYCNQEWLPEEMPGGVKLFIAKAIQFNKNPTGLSGRKMGTVSYSYNTEFPTAIWTYLRPHKRVRFHV